MNSIKLPATNTRRTLSTLGRLVAVLIFVVGLLAGTAVQPAAAATFTVNTTADTADASPGNGVCADASNQCSLRAAIMEANALAGPDVINLPGGTFTLTLAGSDDTANLGDLDVTGPITINGAGQGSTIIQAGTNNTNGIDKIFSFNPLGLGSGFAVSLSNLTLRFGRNQDSFGGGNGFGGCFDFDSGSTGAGSYSMSNVTVTDCSTTDADGGGGAIFLTSGSGAITIANSTFQNNIASRNAPNSGIGGGLFFGCAGGAGAAVTVSNSTISGNTARSLGGNGGQGGGMFFFGACGGSPALNYQMHGVTISNNVAGSDGGGIYSTAPLTIDNAGGPSTISGNTSGRSGGGIWLNHANRTSTISKVTIRNNSALDGGGGIRLDSASTANVLNLSFSRLVNNTAGAGKGSGLSVNNGTANATNNWWGCSTGPSAAPCDTAKVDAGSGGGPAGTGTATFTPWLRVLTTATPNTLLTNQSASLLASVNTNSSGQDVSANVDLLKGLVVSWIPVGGTISGAQTTIQNNGTATASYTATQANASNRAVARVDNDGSTSGSNVASITVSKAETVTTITTDSPDPSVVGQSVAVTYSVISVTGSTPVAPTGNVTVSDGVTSCIATAAAGQCTLTFTSAGARTLNATYAGDANFIGSVSVPVAHQVNKADTTTTITSDNPDPSAAGQSVTVQYSVAVNAPGAGTPTGNVTVSDGVDSCTSTVAAGQCTIALTTSGPRNLTATYAGDSNFNGSASANEPHTVSGFTTTTAITSDSPDPSVVGQAVIVQYAVTTNSGTPTGDVTVSDGTQSCTATVAAGQCTITFTSAGTKSLTATYAGDGTYQGSTSAAEPHQVNKANTTTTITSDNPDPSALNQAVTVQYSVAVVAPGSGTPTGNVTVSDGVVSCTGTAAAGQCTITLTTGGPRNLTAAYAGDSNFNGSTSAVEPHTVDATAPSVEVNQASGQTDPTSDSPIHFTATFSEAVSGFVDSDVFLGGTAGATTVVVSGGPAVYDLAVSGMSSSGTVIASIPASAASDAVGNPNTASSSIDNTVTFVADTTPPDTSIDSNPANPSSSTNASFTFSGSDDQTPAGSLAFECKLDAGAFSSCTSPQSYTGLSFGSHTFQVRAIDEAGNVDPTPATFTWSIVASTSLLYNGAQVVNIGTSFQPAAKLSSPFAGCVSGQTIQFSLDANPTTGAAGTYVLGSAATNPNGQATMSTVITTGWLEGIYTIHAIFSGTASCQPSSDSATLTVASPGNAATGGGWYTLSASGRVNFGFNVRKVDPKCQTGCDYKGNLLLINNGKWRLKGSLTSYSKTSTGQGAASGTGDLFWWDTTLNGGLGDWAIAQQGVSYTINFYDSGKSGKSSKDTFGIRIVYAPVPPQPGTLPNSTPQLIKGGDIKVQ